MLANMMTRCSQRSNILHETWRDARLDDDEMLAEKQDTQRDTFSNSHKILAKSKEPKRNARQETKPTLKDLNFARVENVYHTEEEVLGALRIGQDLTREGVTSYIPHDIQGHEVQMLDGRTLRDHLIQVCEDVKYVFNTKVRATSAEIAKQVSKMKHLGVIKDSQAPYYSQVNLTPKPKPGE